jgi:hypothetical protein
MDELRKYFDNERNRVFTPHPLFAQRLVSLVKNRRLTDIGIWELAPASARSVFAVALILVLSFILLEAVIPQIPNRGLVEAYLEPDQSAAETVLYSDTEVPAGQDFLELIAAEDQ